MTYLLNLVPASPSFDDTLKKYTADIQAAVDYFVCQSAHTRNPKTLKVVEVQDSLLVLELTTKIALPAPAKALRLFTQYLLEHSALKIYVYHRCLFRSVRVANPPQAASPSGQSAQVQVMDALTRMLVGEAPNGPDYFAVFKALLDCSRDMETSCLKKYLDRIQEHITAEARALGHEVTP